MANIMILVQVLQIAMWLNSISAISAASCIQSVNIPHVKTVNMSHQGLKSVPDNMPCLVQKAYLSSNYITSCTSDTFIQYPNLTHIDLSNNYISYFEEGCFRGLKNLQHLNLENNSFAYHTLPNNIFDELLSLKVLIMSKRDVHVDDAYPALPLEPLNNLQEIVLSGIENKTLPDSFENLNSLHTLVFTGMGSTLRNVISDMFYHVRNLPIKRLSFWRAHIQLIENDLQIYLPKLESLNLACSDMVSIQGVVNWFANLPNSTIQHLFLDSVTKINGKISSLKITDFCPNGRHLKSLSAKSIFVSALDFDKINTDADYCLKTLQTIIIGYNSIIPTNFERPIEFSTFVQTLPPQLETLDISGFPSFSTNSPNFCANHISAENSFSDIFIPNLPDLHPVNQTYNTDYPINDNTAMYADVPLGLKYVIAREAYAGATDGRSLVMNPNNSVLYIDLSNGHLYTTVSNTFYGYFQLQVLLLSNNGFTEFSKDICRHCVNLKTLDFSHNKIGLMDPEKLALSLSLPSTSLQFVDLSDNEIVVLSKNLLMDQPNLRKLMLRNNRIRDFPLSLNIFKKLEVLDLSFNSFSELQEQFLNQIVNVSSRNVKFRLHMQGNIMSLQCTPYILNFLAWLRANPTVIPDAHNVTVSLGSVKNVNLAHLITVFESSCVSSSSLVMYILVPCICVIGISLALIVAYKQRWKLKWAYYNFKLRQEMRENRFEMDGGYDAFIAHNHTIDYQWVIQTLLPVCETEWGMRIYIGYRDFPAGGSIAENIVRAIQACKKTVLLVSPAYLESEWCDFETNMALLKGIHSVVIIKLGDLPERRMSRLVKYLLKSVKYIDWIPEREEECFEQLKVALTLPEHDTEMNRI